MNGGNVHSDFICVCVIYQNAQVEKTYELRS